MNNEQRRRVSRRVGLVKFCTWRAYIVFSMTRDLRTDKDMRKEGLKKIINPKKVKNKRQNSEIIHAKVQRLCRRLHWRHL
jgi:hypothetical protein